MRLPLSCVVTLVLVLCSAEPRAEEPKVVLDGLNNPCSVAVQPETGHVFVAESGAGRILRLADGKAEPIIVGFPIDVYGEGPKYKIGPLGMAFIDRNTLVIGGGGRADEDELIYVAQLPESGTETLSAESLLRIGPLEVTDQSGAEGNFHGVAATKSAIYATANGDDEKGWIVQADIKSTADLGLAESYGELRRFIATKSAVDVDAPAGIAISGRGEIVVGQMGETNQSRDSLLVFYRSTDGKLLLNLKTELYDLVALAYGPPKAGTQRSALYALDFAWSANELGGLFRLDSDLQGGQLSVRATRIATLDKPTSLAFAPDGSLYVTSIGTLHVSQTPAGKLWRFGPGL